MCVVLWCVVLVFVVSCGSGWLFLFFGAFLFRAVGGLFCWFVVVRERISLVSCLCGVIV